MLQNKPFVSALVLKTMRKVIVTRLRYILALQLGIFGSVFVWYLIASFSPMFVQLGGSGLVPSAVASIFGGFVTASISPSNKVRVAAIAGFCISLPMYFYLFRYGLSHHGRNPFFWYWPIYVLPLFCLGGFLGRGVWRYS